jgi:hypothetical protein
VVKKVTHAISGLTGASDATQFPRIGQLVFPATAIEQYRRYADPDHWQGRRLRHKRDVVNADIADELIAYCPDRNGRRENADVLNIAEGIRE